jgi:hypothetical protein
VLAFVVLSIVADGAAVDGVLEDAVELVPPDRIDLSP